MHDKIHAILGRDKRCFTLAGNCRYNGMLTVLKERNGTICNIFSGYRFTEPKGM